MKNIGIRIFCFLCIPFIICVVNSCSIENYSTKKLAADNEILSYIADNEYDSKPDSLGLVYIPIKSGNGFFPERSDVVAFHYVGYYLNGEKFDSSYDNLRPLVVKLGEGHLIKGLEYSLLKMDKGAKSMVIIPFYLAYDDMENGPVPPYSNLVFEIELIDIDRDEK